MIISGDINSITITGIANEEYSSKLFSALKNKGKQWNPIKLCIEDISQRKFKPGDKVKLKDGRLDQGGGGHFLWQRWVCL